MAIANMPDFKDRGVSPDLPRDERKRRNYEALVRNYYRTLLSVDENVSRALEYLDKNDLAKNTVVVLRQRILPRRIRSVRQAVDVRRRAARAAALPLAREDQSGNHRQRAPAHQRRHRADAARDRRRADSFIDAGPQFPAHASGPGRAVTRRVLLRVLRVSRLRPLRAQASRSALGKVEADRILGATDRVRAVRPVPAVGPCTPRTL
jgi:hypothetical protein